MTQGTREHARPPFAAYGPAGAGYGPAPSVAEPVVPSDRAAGPVPPAAGWPAPAEPPGSHLGLRPRRALGIVSLVLAVLGAVIALTPSAWLPAWALLLASLVLAIVHLSRRGTTRVAAVFALVVGVIGILIALVVGIIAGISSALTPDRATPAVDDDTIAERLIVADRTAPATPFETGWGTPAIVRDAETGDDVWSVRALTPIDITGETADVSPAPISVSGSFVAVPFEITNVSGASIDPDAWQFLLPTDYRAPDGSTADSVYDPALMDVYPSRYDIVEPIAPGQSVLVYEIRDVAAADAADGTAELWLYSGDSVTWTSAGDDVDAVPG